MLLDGHIQLSAQLGAGGVYPAIDILRSKSRLMTRMTGEAHRESARRVREWLAVYQDVELLLQIGEYRQGADRASDRAIERHLQFGNSCVRVMASTRATNPCSPALHALSAAADASS